eukprot:g11772.t1
MKDVLIYGLDVYEDRRTCREGQAEGILNTVNRSLSYTKYWLATLDEDAFVDFLCLQQELAEQERVSRFEDLVNKLSLSQEEQELWKHDLVSWELRFHEYNPSRGHWGDYSGFVPEQQVLLLLRDSGLVPKSPARVMQVKSMLQSLLRPDGTVSFLDFLKVVTYLKDLEKEKVGKIVDELTDQNCCVPAREVCTFFRSCGLISKVQSERMEAQILNRSSKTTIKRTMPREVQELVDQGDGRGSKFLGRAPVIELWIRLHALLKVTAVERERQYVLTNGGWTEHDYIDFKKAFHRYDEDPHMDISRI